MSKRVKTCIGFLELLINTYRMTSHLSRTLLAEATREHVLCVAEVVLNTLEGNLELPHSMLSELSRSKRVLRKVSRIVRGIGSGSDSGNGATHDPRSHHGTTIRVDTSGRRQFTCRLQFGEVLSLKTVGGPLATEIHPQSRSHRSFLKLEIVEMSSTRRNPLTARYTTIRPEVCTANATSQY